MIAEIVYEVSLSSKEYARLINTLEEALNSTDLMLEIYRRQNGEKSNLFTSQLSKHKKLRDLLNKVENTRGRAIGNGNR